MPIMKKALSRNDDYMAHATCAEKRKVRLLTLSIPEWPKLERQFDVSLGKAMENI